MSAELSASPEFMNFQHRAVHTKQLPWRVACWKNARSDAVNLAEVLTDGQKLHIPYIGEDAVAEASGQTTATDSKEATDATVNINTATVDMLMTLKGIGQTRQRYHCVQRKHGSFQNKEDIMNVDGIKQGTYDKIKDNISVQ